MTNKDYWRRRFEQLEQREMDKADKAMADLKKVYEYTLRQLRDEVIEWYTRYADENGLSLADARKQLDARELKAFKLTLKEYEKLAKQQDLSDEYIKMLDQASIRARLSRSQMLYIKTANYVEQLAKQQEINLTELLKDVYEDSYYRTAYETQSMQGAYDTFSEVPKTSVEKAISKPWAEDGKDFSERIWDNKTKLLNTLQSEITRTLIAAEGTTLLAGRIANRFNVSFSNARRLAETETAYVQETARMDTWQKLHVAKYELIATLDSRTSPICRDMDGKVFDRVDAKPGVTMPPFHCYCRTTTAPYIEGITEDDDSTRAARDPDTGKTVQVPGKMSYADWKAVFVDKSKTLEDWREPKVADAAMAEEKKPFTPAKSKDEAFLRFKELTNPGFKLDEKLHLNTMNAVLEAMEEVHQKFGIKIPINEFKNRKAERTSRGGFTDEGRILALPGRSANFVSTQKRMAERLFKKGWWATDHKYDNIYHEIGHSIYNILPTATKKEINKIFHDTRHTNYETWMELGGYSRAGKTQAELFSKTLSGYAFTNEDEFFAEAFAQIMAKKMRPVSRLVKKQLDAWQKSFQSTPKPDIIKNRVGEGVAQVHYIGKIDKEIYKVVTPDIRTDEVIITDKQIQHIKERHPNDYERFVSYFAEILTQPDYILEANKPHTAVILKEIQVKDEQVKLILRLQTPSDPEEFKNSIITFMKIDIKDWNRLLRNKKILYKKKSTG